MAKPYHDKETLRELYHDEGLAQDEIGEKFGVDQSTIRYWMKKHDIGERVCTTKIEPGTHRDADTLRELYHGQELTQREVAERLGVQQTTIRVWMKRHNIEARDNAEMLAEFKRKDSATFLMDNRGYEKWACRYGEDMDWVYVHRLLAVAEYGFEAVKDMHVHHKNEIKWDNRPENIVPMTPSDHLSHHNNPDGEPEVMTDGGVATTESDTSSPEVATPDSETPCPHGDERCEGIDSPAERPELCWSCWREWAAYDPEDTLR